jgi:hypothetical protein
MGDTTTKKARKNNGKEGRLRITDTHEDDMISVEIKKE